ncbi:MAG TPA: hypothetical protein VMP68_12690 [Candidatus Eisenbacteria bacterium]|nr:hypothetical protein [Candidatus Eisenbacteria bacterium]
MSRLVLSDLAIVRRFATFLALSLGVGCLSCGTPGHAIMVLNAPATVVAGVPFSVTVTVMYQGKRDTVFDGPVFFITSDKAFVQPLVYVYTAADAGQHTFTNLVLFTPGMQTFGASDYDARPITGSVQIQVNPAP